MNKKLDKRTLAVLNFLEDASPEERGLILTYALLDGQVESTSLNMLGYISSMVLGYCAYSESEWRTRDDEQSDFTEFRSYLNKNIVDHVSNIAKLTTSVYYKDVIFDLAQNFKTKDIGNDNEN